MSLLLYAIGLILSGSAVNIPYGFTQWGSEDLEWFEWTRFVYASGSSVLWLNFPGFVTLAVLQQRAQTSLHAFLLGGLSGMVSGSATMWLTNEATSIPDLSFLQLLIFLLVQAPLVLLIIYWILGRTIRLRRSYLEESEAIPLIRYTTRSFAALHVLVGVLLIPLSIFVGPGLGLFVDIAGVWLIILGTKLWKPKQGIQKAILVTHMLLLIFSAALVRDGMWSLHQAELSAREGGGLLGGIGLIPIYAACVLAIFSILSIATFLLVRRT